MSKRPHSDNSMRLQFEDVLRDYESEEGSEIESEEIKLEESERSEFETEEIKLEESEGSEFETEEIKLEESEGSEFETEEIKLEESEGSELKHVDSEFDQFPLEDLGSNGDVHPFEQLELHHVEIHGNAKEPAAVTEHDMRAAIDPLCGDGSPRGRRYAAPGRRGGGGSAALSPRSLNGSPARRGGRARGRVSGRGSPKRLHVGVPLQRRGVVRRSAGGDWVRGSRLVEKFRSPEQIPEHIAEQIADLNSKQEAIAARERGKAAPPSAWWQWHDAEDFRLYDPHEFTWEPITDIAGESRETFLPKNPGPTRRFETPYAAFRAYWDDEIINHIVTETNEYAQGIQSERFHQEWFPTNPDEMLLFFAFWMMLAIIRMPTIKSCFSLDPLFRTDVFRSLFTESRYWNLNRAFHLARGSRDTNSPGNILYPIEHVLDHFNTKCQELFVPYQNICIDESLTLWKGDLAIKQYIKTKAAKLGIKTQQLCDSMTGYLYSFFVYLGSRDASLLPQATSTVLRLIRPLLNKGYTVFMDNWFNSPKLAKYLKERGTDCVGTLRDNRRHVPAIIHLAPLEEGEFVARSSGNVRVIGLHDRKRISLISTYHDLTQVQKPGKSGNTDQFRLKLVDDYNKSMGGVDRLDQMLEPYLVERKQCSKWTKKLFKRILNISIQNARILVQQSTNTNIDSLVFRVSLVSSIIKQHQPSAARRPAAGGLLRLAGRHFIERIPLTAENSRARHRSNRARLRCSWCPPRYQRTRRTVYQCKQCQVPLCLESCFEEYHTIP